MRKIEGIIAYLLWVGIALVIFVILAIIQRVQQLPWWIWLFSLPAAVIAATVITFVIVKKWNK